MSTRPLPPLHALIVDDELHGRDVVRHLLRAHPDIVVVGEAANGARALEAIRELRPEVLFLDIRMPKLSGLQLVDALGDGAPPIVIFTTAYDVHAVEAFERCAFDYLLKPFDQERFDRTLARARQRLHVTQDAALGRRLRALFDTPAESEPAKGDTSTRVRPEPLDRFVVKDAGRVFFVPANDVDWLEAAGNYVGLRVRGRTHLIHDSLSALERRLDAHRFLRIHRSTIVNVTRIKELQPFTNGEFVVILQDGSQLKLSRSFRAHADQVLGL